jgi:hypothetical protein
VAGNKACFALPVEVKLIAVFGVDNANYSQPDRGLQR